MADPQPNHDELISQFVSVAGVSPQVAEEYLANSSWDLSSAITEYYNPTEETVPKGTPQSSSSAAASVPQPIPTSSSMPPPTSQVPKKKFATLGDLRGGGGPGHEGHGHDDDDDDEDENQDLYAGGEKSGLAVENPDDIRRKIMEKAKRQMQKERSDGSTPQATSSRFTGTARTLGGDDIASEVIEDPNASVPQPTPPAERRLHFWGDGFSVDDGPLYRLDDPVNAAILAQIKKGRAPVNILNLEPGQDADVKLEQHEGNYVQPKKKYTPFGSGGQRLGSPTPGVIMDNTTSASAPAAAHPVESTGAAQPKVDINESEPTVQLQIRLVDGTRLVSQFNTSHTIGDIYNFINASNGQTAARGWVLMTTFPSKELRDKSQTLGGLSEFKRGGVVVQKWT